MNTESTISHYRLPMLPGVLALHYEHGLLVYLTCERASPVMHQAQVFAAKEIRVLVPLLSYCPEHCPYAEMIASFSGDRSERAVNQAAEWIATLRATGEWERAMTPLQTTVCRARLKLEAFGLTILALREVGYVLTDFEH